MFNFRIITMQDGSQVIDRSLKTPENSLTPFQFAEYTEMDCLLEEADKMEQKRQRGIVEAERSRKLSRNPLYKIACACGLV